MSLEQVRDIQGPMGLRAKIVVVTAVSILIIASVFTACFLSAQRSLLRTEMHDRATSLAKNLARGSAEALLHEDVPAIGQMAAGFMNEGDVAFLGIRGAGGRLIFSLTGREGVPVSETTVDAMLPPANGVEIRTVEKDDLLVVGLGVRRAADEEPAVEGNSGDSGVPKVIGEAIVVFSLNRIEALADLSVKSMLPIVLGSAVLCLLIVFVVVGRFVKPLKALVFGAKAIGLGNFAFRAPVLTGDELGSLAYCLNEMARTWEEDRRKLNECGTELDNRIRERTAELAGREKELTGILENNPAGILLIEAATGRVSWANSNALKIFGASLAEVGNHLPGEAFPVQRDPPVETIGSHGNVCISECRIPISGAEDVPVLMSVGRIAYNGAEHFLHAFFDITEYKQLENQLLQVQKMGAVGTLAGGIAHDFNNLLQAILGSVQLVLLKGDVTPQGRKLLHQVEKTVQRGADLIRQLLTFSRKVESRLRPLDLNQEIRRVVTLLGRTIPRPIRIELDLTEDLEQIDGDPLHLEQVIVNLAVNSRDAMPHGGTLTIQTKRVLLDEESCRGRMDLEPGEYTLLRISDTGTGMDRETLEHIFEPFFTTKEVGKGTGLGLAMVYGIIKSHGGHISCWSRPGCGTSFDIHLRLATGDAVPLERGEDQGLEVCKEAGTILLVDDEEPILQLGAEVLEGCGIHGAFSRKRGKGSGDLRGPQRPNRSGHTGPGHAGHWRGSHVSIGSGIFSRM